MPGVVIILLVLVLIPVMVCMGGALIAAALGWSLYRDGQERNEGSELVDLNV